MFLRAVCFIILIRTSASAICDEKFTNNAGGVINQPGFSDYFSDSFYQPGLDCVYTITVNTNRYLTLEWEYFNIRGKMPDCYEDYVEIHTGCSFPKNIISRFCSTNMVGLPHTIYSKDNCMEIRFHSKAGGTNYNGGFKASYRSYSITSYPSPWTQCSSSSYKTSSSGVIGSPGWPIRINTAAFPLFSDCKWTIKQYDTNKLIKLNFMDKDVSDSYYCTAHSQSYVEVEEEESILTSTKRSYYHCKGSPSSIETKFYELDIKLRAGVFVSGRGFVVGWVTYTNDKAISAKNLGWIAGAAIGLIALGVIALLVFRRYKRRSSSTHAHQLIPAQNATTTTVTMVSNANTSQTTSSGYPQQKNMLQTEIQVPKQGYPDQPPPPYPGPYLHDGSTAYPPQQFTYQPYPAYLVQQPAYPPVQPQNTTYPPPYNYGNAEPPYLTK